MGMVKKIASSFMSVVLLSATLFLGGCEPKEKITEQVSLETVTNYYNQIVQKAVKEGFILDEPTFWKPQFDEEARWSSAWPEFYSENLELSILIQQELSKKYVFLRFTIETNKEILMQNEVIDEVQKVLNILNSVSSRQYTEDEIVELLTNDKHLTVPMLENEAECRYRAFDFWRDFDMEYCVYKDEHYDVEHKYRLCICSKTNDI